MKVTVFDYGAGNLHSLARALAGAGDEIAIEPDPIAALDTDVLVLPGVGAFAPAAARLAPGRERMRQALEDGLPCLGICLGMQLLFDASDEGPGAGLGRIAGRVTPVEARRVPHIGWNAIESPSDPMLERAPLPLAYFANGYVCRPADPRCVTAWTTHERDRFPAVVRIGRTVGVQFHPEKSSRAGVAFVQACLAEAR